MGLAYGEFCARCGLNQSDPDSLRIWLLSHCLPEGSWKRAALEKIMSAENHDQK